MFPSPLIYYGGKGFLVKHILKYIPPHHTYVEVFGGSGKLLFAKQPSPVEVFNDIDADLINFFRVLKDPKLFDTFYRMVLFTPFSREEHTQCYLGYRDKSLSKLERAYKFFVANRQGFSGKFNFWGYVITKVSSGAGMCASCMRWLGALDSLPNFHHRLRNVKIENCDFREIIPRYDAPETFMYLDPPYVPATRTLKKFYYSEMSVEDHAELVSLLLAGQGKYILSGYWHEVYLPLEEAGWVRLEFDVVSHAAGRVRGSKLRGKGSAKQFVSRKECLWLSPSVAKHFHLL